MELLLEIALIFSGVIVAVCLAELGTDRLGAPWAPTSKKLVQKMLVLANLGANDLLYDLGSGDGRIIVRASREFHARSVGIEINPFWVLWTRLKIALFGLKDKSRVAWGNLFKMDLSEADVVTLYLHQGTNDKLKTKLEQELKPGARIVSHVFTFDDWNAVKTDPVEHIYVYIR